MYRAYRYRLDPTREQEQMLLQFAGARRYVWNWALNQHQAHYQKTGKNLPARDLSAHLTAIKRQANTAWLCEMDSQVLQQTLADLRRAFSHFFARRARFPRYRSRKRDQPRFRIPQRVTVGNASVRVPKIGQVRARISRPIDGKPKSATFKRQADGHWYVTIVAEVEMQTIPLPLPDPGHSIGVDMGVTNLIVCSNGERVSSPRFYRRSMRQLRRAQRSLSRKQQRSRNREKARMHVARLHHKVANQRADHAHKLTTRLIRSYQAVCIEDLNVKGLAKSKLALFIHDVAWGMLRRQLEYKGQWYGTHVVPIDRWFPSTKRCRVCGHINDALTLSERTWTCTCGISHDRDLNASLNIKDEGLRILYAAVGHTEARNACGQSVSLPTGASLAIPLKPERSKNPAANGRAECQYCMTVEIKDVAAGCLGAVEHAAGEEWAFSDWTRTPHNQGTSATGESYLVGGETEDDFARRLARAVWSVNGAYCPVSISATCLEDLPCETYCPGEGDYAAYHDGQGLEVAP